LKEALEAAVQNLKQWRNIDFAPQKSNQTPKYPMPDEVFSETNYQKDGFVKNTGYLRKMTGKTADDYQTYLEIRKNHADASEKRKVVCLQMSNVSRREDWIAQVAEFEF